MIVGSTGSSVVVAVIDVLSRMRKSAEFMNLGPKMCHKTCTYLNPGPRLGLAGSVVVVIVRFRVERNRPQPPSRVGAAPAGEELGAAALPGGHEVPFRVG